MSAIRKIHDVGFDWSHFASQTDQFSILRNVLFSGQTLIFLRQQVAGNIQPKSPPSPTNLPAQPRGAECVGRLTRQNCNFERVRACFGVDFKGQRRV